MIGVGGGICAISREEKEEIECVCQSTCSCIWKERELRGVILQKCVEGRGGEEKNRNSEEEEEEEAAAATSLVHAA
jgi:hypothetical protein